MPRPSLREKIVNSGVRTLHERGFAGAGIREISSTDDNLEAVFRYLTES